MALAPVERLVQALEASVWKTPRPGAPEVFDAHELAEWIGTWLDIGTAFTAERLAAVPDDHLALYLSQLAIVATGAMWGFERSTEIGDLDRIYAPSHDETSYGPYVASARRQEDWETLRGALDALWADAPERLLHLFAQLSGAESMLQPQRNRESANDDLTLERESARERQGYVTAHGARAFLALAKRPLTDLAEMSEYDPETRRHLDRLGNDPPLDAQSRAAGAGDHCDGRALATRRSASELAALQAALEEARLLDAPPSRLLLPKEAARRDLPIVKLLRALAEADAAEFESRGRELAYLSGVLVAGISVGGTPLTPAEAHSASLATCNLGLETLTAGGKRAAIDREPGLVRLFLMGCSVLATLPGRVVEAFVQRLERLKQASSEPLHEWLLEQAEDSVAELREAVARADFEAARDATMALCFVFEPRACQELVPLLDELPRLGTARSGTATWIDSLAGISRALELLRELSGNRGRRDPR